MNMNTTPPTPPPPASGASGGGKPDAKAFFRSRYESIAEVPRGPYSGDIAAFEKDFGKDHGYSPEELNAIIKQSRDEARKERPKGDSAGGIFSTAWLQIWASRILATTFGVYILASIGILVYATAFAKVGWTWQALEPYILGILGVGLFLVVAGVGKKWAEGLKLSDRATATFLWVILGVLSLVILAVGVWVATFFLRQAGWLTPIGVAAISPPGELSFDRAWTCSDDKTLPNELFGAFGDTTEKPREWMRTQEAGALSMLGDSQGQVCWLLTKEKANTKYEARINVGTQDDITIVAYVVLPRRDVLAPASFIPLRQVFSADKAVYHFQVPALQEPSQLLFFLAMKQLTFKRWGDDKQQFVIKS